MIFVNVQIGWGETMKLAIVESLEPRISNSEHCSPKGQRFPAQVAPPSFFPFPPPQNTLSLAKAEEAEKKGKRASICFNKRGRLFSFFCFEAKPRVRFCVQCFLRVCAYLRTPVVILTHFLEEAKEQLLCFVIMLSRKQLF